MVNEALATPRIIFVSLQDGRSVHIRELNLREAWPYIQGQGVNPDAILRQSLCDAEGNPVLAADESLPLALGLELLPKVLELNGLEANPAEAVDEVESDLSLVGSRG